MREYHAPFEVGHFYHIYNQGNNKENLFREERNYYFFLQRWQNYLNDYLEVWAYCLMPNHFHFLIRIKDEASFPDETPVNKFLEVQFKRLFSSYTLSVNKVYDRSGSLFRKRFKRTLVDSQEYLTTLIHYIHHNPIHHHFTDDFKCWHYSSYSAIIGNGLTKVEREKVMELFGGRDRFIRFHSGLKEYKKIKPLLIE